MASNRGEMATMKALEHYAQATGASTDGFSVGLAEVTFPWCVVTYGRSTGWKITARPTTAEGAFRASEIIERLPIGLEYYCPRRRIGFRIHGIEADKAILRGWQPYSGWGALRIESVADGAIDWPALAERAFWQDRAR